MAQKVSFIAFLLLMATGLWAQTPLSIGTIRTIKSSVLKEERTLNIYLPHAYDEKKEYPVIYLLDGSMHEDFLHIVGLVQFFNLQFKMPECIVVGISNVDRKRDFTFHTDIEELKKSYPTTGHSAPFIQFIETELQPYIQSSFKTNGTNILIGQSLGGLLASEILMTKPGLFSHYLIVSPSLWWDDESLLSRPVPLATKEAYVYISVGDKEHPVMQKDAKDLADILAKQPLLKVEYVPMLGENHATILHKSIYEALSRLFPYKE